MRIAQYFRQHIDHPPRQGIRSACRNYLPWARALSASRTNFESGIPWINFNSAEFILQQAGELSRVAEYGSGGSTLFFLSRVPFVATVEHDPSWFQSVSAAVQRRGWQNQWHGILSLPEPFRPASGLDPADPENYLSGDGRNFTYRCYASALDSFADSFFDLVLVDGRARPSCVKHASPKIKDGGFLVLDNTERSYYLTPMTRSHLRGFVTVFDEFGPTPGLAHFNRTTIFRKTRGFAHGL